MDNADRATTVIERAMAHYQAQHHAAPARRIGICQDCGERIEVERMQAMPYAVRCIECQTEQEERKARRG